MNNLTTFGDRVEKILTIKHLQKKDLASRINKTTSNLSNILRADNLKLDTVYCIANALDCSIDYLLGRTDNPQAHRDETILTDRELMLITQFRALNEQGREMLIGQAGLLAGSPQYSIKSDERPLTVASSDNK